LGKYIYKERKPKIFFFLLFFLLFFFLQKVNMNIINESITISLNHLHLDDDKLLVFEQQEDPTYYKNNQQHQQNNNNNDLTTTSLIDSIWYIISPFGKRK
jgi:hypothetical protein